MSRSSENAVRVVSDTGNKMEPEWRRTAFVVDDDKVYLPIEIADPVESAYHNAAIDGIELIEHESHHYAPLRWLATEDGRKEAWDELEAKLIELAKRAPATAQEPPINVPEHTPETENVFLIPVVVDEDENHLPLEVRTAYVYGQEVFLSTKMIDFEDLNEDARKAGNVRNIRMDGHNYVSSKWMVANTERAKSIAEVVKKILACVNNDSDNLNEEQEPQPDPNPAEPAEESNPAPQAQGGKSN